MLYLSETTKSSRQMRPTVLSITRAASWELSLFSLCRFNFNLPVYIAPDSVPVKRNILAVCVMDNRLFVGVVLNKRKLEIFLRTYKSLLHFLFSRLKDSIVF